MNSNAIVAEEGHGKGRKRALSSNTVQVDDTAKRQRQRAKNGM